ncbi:MAG: hypothetical protein U0793_11340 [Gemmataceae bacterium]
MFLALALRDGVNEQGFDAIALGMTKREVVTILNRLPTAPRPAALGVRPFPFPDREGEMWRAEECALWLLFDKQGRVSAKMFHMPGRQGARTRLFVPDGAAVFH